MRLSERVDCLMVTSDQHGEHSSLLLPIVVVLERSHLLVFFRTVHIIEIRLVPNGLEISTDYQQIKFFCKLGFHLGDMCIDGVEFSMQAPLNCDLSYVLITLIVYYISIMFNLSPNHSFLWPNTCLRSRDRNGLLYALMACPLSSLIPYEK